MANIYIDESGSMTHEVHIKKNKYFITTLILVEEPEKLKRVHKRFIQKNFSKLKAIDTDSKMFDGNDFIELKGSAFTPDMKREFVSYFCRNNHFRVFYIKIDNSKASQNLYKSKARAFNYVLKLAFEHLNNRGILVDRNWVLNIDERNLKTEAKHQLNEFLNTELSTGKDIVDDISVQYFNSSQNKIIQVADVFSNLFYSNILTEGTYDNEIKHMIDNGYLLNIFRFPLTE
ncbi:DUF3800 domain-containing protein [Phosphitispora fastidiosa]|uniref:DUF3800 domain-containing protein n=1 Tax=Phosphitispora fastidiosa TaxID=2837202 RepID=UPI001E3F6007|nr:DUF3800 domain-containing protein [Phosphitispora fastidiosa]MBU7005824.1 hypothetical protein [Phosphitispora fastidiosa]